MSDNVLESFVVALGWKNDEASQKKMEAGVEAMAKGVAGLTVALGAVALAAVAAVAKIASAFNTLEYTSARTGSSVATLKSMSYALSQVGGSAQEATAIVEGFARATRNNPGLTKFVKDLGVDVKADKWDQILGVVEKLKEKPYYIGAQQAEMLGISEQSFNTMSKHLDALKHYKAERDRIAHAVGLNDDDAAKASVAWSRALGTFSAFVEAIVTKLAVVLIPALTWVMDKLNLLFNFLAKKSEELQADGSFLRTWEKLASIFDSVSSAIEKVVKWLHAIDRATDTSEGLKMIGRLLGFIETSTARPGFSLRDGLGPVADTQEGTKGIAEKPGIIRRTWESAKRAVGLGAVADDGPRVRQSGSVPVGQSGREQRAMTRLIARGWTPEAAATAIGQAVEESGVRSDGPLGDTARFGTGDAAAHGMFQWRDGRFRALKKFAEERKVPWTDFDTQVDFFDQERKQRSARERDWHTVTDLGEGNRNGKAFEGYAGGLQAQREAHARRLLETFRKAPQAAPVPLSFPKLPFNPSGFNVNALGAAPALGSSTSNTDASRSVTQHIKQEMRIETSDPARAAGIMERSMGRMNSDALANAQTAVR